MMGRKEYEEGKEGHTKSVNIIMFVQFLLILQKIGTVKNTYNSLRIIAIF